MSNLRIFINLPGQDSSVVRTSNPGVHNNHPASVDRSHSQSCHIPPAPLPRETGRVEVLVGVRIFVYSFFFCFMICCAPFIIYFGVWGSCEVGNGGWGGVCAGVGGLGIILGVIQLLILLLHNLFAR